MDPERIKVVLIATRNPLNIGAVARAISNFGVGRLRLVIPYDVAWKEARSAVNASAVLESAEVFGSVAESIADCRLVIGTTSVGHRELQHTLRRLDAAGPLIRQEATEGNVAILFGSEKYGISNEDLSYCQWLVRIPTREAHGSMNLGQAAAVCLYELIRRDTVAETVERKAADAARVDRFTDSLLELLKLSGYASTDSTEMKIRRMVRRLNLPATDMEAWLGVVRQIRWKVDHPGANGSQTVSGEP